MSESEHERIAALKNEILNLTYEYWSSTSKALLLASLGQQLTKRGYNLRTDLRGQKLVPFLQIELKDQVTVLTSPFDSLVRGIVPKGEDIGADIRSLFTPNTERGSARINFDKRVWIAFSNPIPENHVRVLQFEPEINFEDLPAEMAKDKEHMVVPRELVIPPAAKPSQVRNAELQQNIRSWLKDHGIGIEKVVAKATIEASARGTDSLLSAILAALDRKDLERVSLPLDIVAKLHSERSKIR